MHNAVVKYKYGVTVLGILIFKKNYCTVKSVGRNAIELNLVSSMLYIIRKTIWKLDLYALWGKV